MIVLVIPVLRRPHGVQRLVDSIENATPLPHRTLFVCSPSDHAEIDAVTDADAEYICTPEDYARGDYARKINLAYHQTDEPLLFLGADDLAFHDGWLECVIEAIADGADVVGTNDLGSDRVMKGLHATHSVVTRDYVMRNGTIDEADKILHEGYWHEYVDDEFIGTAKHRGAFVSANDSHVEHLHPSWGKGEMDDLYAMQGSRMAVGRRLYDRRRHLWA